MNNKKKLIIKRSQINEVVNHLLKTLDDNQLEELDFEGIENLAIDLTTEFGNEIIQNIVNRKSEKKRPKNIKFNHESKKKL
jgi:hypothetical protein